MLHITIFVNPLVYFNINFSQTSFVKTSCFPDARIDTTNEVVSVIITLLPLNLSGLGGFP